MCKICKLGASDLFSVHEKALKVKYAYNSCIYQKIKFGVIVHQETVTLKYFRHPFFEDVDLYCGCNDGYSSRRYYTCHANVAREVDNLITLFELNGALDATKSKFACEEAYNIFFSIANPALFNRSNPNFEKNLKPVPVVE